MEVSLKPNNTEAVYLQTIVLEDQVYAVCKIGDELQLVQPKDLKFKQ